MAVITKPYAHALGFDQLHHHPSQQEGLKMDKQTAEAIQSIDGHLHVIYERQGVLLGLFQQLIELQKVANIRLLEIRDKTV